MRLIDQTAEIVKPSGNILKDIELAARVSYKSEDKITENSAETMVNRLIKLGHFAPLEFGTVYLKIPVLKTLDIITEANAKGCFAVPYVHKNQVTEVENGIHVTYYYITTNYRFIVENKLEKMLEYTVEPTEHHDRRITVKFVTNRSVSHELVRHRVFSFMQESQRFCNYNKGKFNYELTFIKPTWLDIPTGQYIYWDGDWCDVNKMKIQFPADTNNAVNSYIFLLADAESTYTLLLNSGWKPQQARTVLPNDTKTEIYMCGFESDWEHFFELRDVNTVDPMMYELAHKLHEQFNNK